MGIYQTELISLRNLYRLKDQYGLLLESREKDIKVDYIFIKNLKIY